MIVTIPRSGRRYEVLLGICPVRQRVQRRDTYSNGMQAIRRNFRARKWRLREQVDRRGVWVAAGKISGAFECGWNIRHSRNAFTNPAALVIGEEKCLVLLH